MGFSAITARLGLDAAPFNSSLNQAVANAKKGGQQIESGLQFKGAGAIKRQIGGITQSIVAGGSAADIFAGSALHLANTLRLGLGGAVALGAGAVLIKTLMDAHDAAVATQKEIDLLTKPHAAAGFREIGDIAKQFDALAEHAKTLKLSLSKEGFSGILEELKTIGAHPIDFFSRPDAGSHDFRDDQLGVVQAQQTELMSEAAVKQKQIADIEAARISTGEHVARILKLQVEYQEKITAAQTKYGKGKGNPLIDVLQKEGQAAIAEENRQEKERQRRSVEGIDDSSAQAEIGVAGAGGYKGRSALMQESLLRRQIAAAKKEGKEAVDDVGRNSALEKEVQLSGKLRALVTERKKEEADALRINTASADVAAKEAAGDKYGAEQARIKADFAERNIKASNEGLHISAQLNAQEKAALAESTHRHETEQRHSKDAIEDATEQAAIEKAAASDKYTASLMEEQLLAKKRDQAKLDLDAAKGEDEQNAATAKLVTAEGQLAAAIATRKTNEANTLIDLKAQTKEINLQVAGKKSLAQVAAIDEKYRQAEIGKSPAEKAELEKKKAAELRGLAVDRQLMTPEEKRAEKAEERKRAQAARIVDARNGKGGMLEHDKQYGTTPHDWSGFDDNFPKPVPAPGKPKPPQGVVDALAAASQLAAGIGLQAAGGMAAGPGSGGPQSSPDVVAAVNGVISALNAINFGLG